MLLHGLGVNSSSWAYQVEALSQAGYHVIAPDLRGFGQSRFSGRMNVPVMSGDVIALLAAIKPGKRVDLVGISMGGTVALQLGIEAPQLVRRMVLINTFAKIRIRGLGHWMYMAARLSLSHTLGIETQGRLVAKRLFPDPQHESQRQAFRDQLSQADPKAYRAALRMLARFDVQKHLRTIQARALVISAEDDTTVSMLDQTRLAKGIPRARHEHIQEGGHPIIVTRPEIVNSLLLDFLGQASF